LSKFINDYFQKTMKNLIISRTKLLDAFHYLFGSSLSKLIPFLILPIFSSRLSLDEYGQLEIFNVLNSLAYPLLTMSIAVNISRNYGTLDRDRLDSIVQNIVLILGINFLILGILSLSLNLDFLLDKSIVFAILVISFLNGIIQIKTTLLRQEGKPILFNFYEIARVGLGLIFSVLIIDHFSVSWKARPYGLLTGLTLVSIISFWSIYKEFFKVIKLSFREIKKLYKISFPLIFHGLGVIVINFSDKLLISEFINLSTVAIYSSAYTISMAVIIFTEAFLRTWTPWFYLKQNIIKVFQSVLIYIVILFFISMVIAFGGKFLLFWLVDYKYHSAAILIPYLSFSFFIYGIYLIAQPFVILYGRTSIIANGTILSAILNIVLNIILLKKLGVFGAVISTTFSFLFNLVFITIYIIRLNIISKTTLRD